MKLHFKASITSLTKNIGYLSILSFFVLTSSIVLAQTPNNKTSGEVSNSLPSANTNNNDLPVIRGQSNSAVNNKNPSMQEQSNVKDSDQSNSSPSKSALKPKVTIGSETLYTWYDPDGNFHITNTPPPDFDQDKNKQSPTQIEITKIQRQQEVLSNEERLTKIEDDGRKIKEAAKKEKEEKAKKAVYCDNLQRRMNLYQSDHQINVLGNDGKPQIVDDNSRAKTLNAIQDSYSANCQ